MTYYYASSDGVLSLSTNIADFKWSWGMRMPLITEAAYHDSAVKLRVLLDDSLSFDGQESRGKYHYFAPGDEGDSLVYERNLAGRARLRFQASGLLGDEPTLRFNSHYLRFVKHRFMNLHSAHYIMTDVAAWKMLDRGYAPLHCSGFRYQGSTVLVLAPPNTGKTLTALQACMDYKAEFLAEDLAITDGRRLYSVPWTSTFRYYETVDKSRWSRSLNRLTEALPLIEILPLGKTEPVTSLIPADNVLSASDVTHVVFLERGNGGIQEVDPAEAVRKATNLNRYEFNYVKSPTLVAYEFFNPGVDLDAAAAVERRRIEELMGNAEALWSVSVEDATTYAPELISRLSHA